jgi:hypothetical protein
MQSDPGVLWSRHSVARRPHREPTIGPFIGKIRHWLRIGSKEERRQHRRERNALDARMKAEYMSMYTRDMNGLGRIDPDRRP